MTPEQFTYWLQGFVELNPDIQPTKEQWQMIKEHLQTVFKKVTPELQENKLAEIFRNHRFDHPEAIC